MLTSMIAKRDTKEINRLSYHKVGDPATSNPRTCKKCKVKASEKGTCACDVKNHPDLKQYKIDRDTKVRYDSENSANSELNRIFEPNILELTNRATKSMLDNTMHIDAGNNNSAEQKNGDQSEGKSRMNQPQNSPPHRPTPPAHSERDSPVTMPQEDRDQRDSDPGTQPEGPEHGASHGASSRAALETDTGTRYTPPRGLQQHGEYAAARQNTATPYQSIRELNATPTQVKSRPKLPQTSLLMPINSENNFAHQNLPRDWDPENRSAIRQTPFTLPLANAKRRDTRMREDTHQLEQIRDNLQWERQQLKEEKRRLNEERQRLTKETQDLELNKQSWTQEPKGKQTS
jgi:hypothetical protein